MMSLQVQVCGEAVTLQCCWLLSEAAFTSCFSAAEAQLNQINSSASVTSEPRHILNVAEIKGSATGLAFAFSLLCNVTHQFQ